MTTARALGAIAALLVVASCAKSDKSSKNKDKGEPATEAQADKAPETPTSTPASATPAPTPEECKNAIGDALFTSLEKNALRYGELTFPAEGTKCEPLRVFISDKVVPIAKAFRADMDGLRSWSRGQSEACRVETRKTFSPRMNEIVKKMRETSGKKLEQVQNQARDCMDHKGMAEAFEAAGMRKAKPKPAPGKPAAAEPANKK